MIARAQTYVRKFDRNLWVLSAGLLVSSLGFAVSIPFISLYFNAELGLSMTEIGVFFGVLAIVRSAFQIAGGEISDRIDRRHMLSGSQVLRAATFFMLGVAVWRDWGFWPVAVLVLLTSISGAVFHPAADAMVSDILPPDKRLDGFAISRAARNVGWAVGPALGGFLAASSYAALFFVASGITVASAIMLKALLKVTNQIKATDRFKLSDIPETLKDRTLAVHLVLTFMIFLVVAQFMAPLSLYAVQIVGLSKIQLGYLYTINGVLVSLAQLPITRLLSGIRLTTQLAMGAVLYAIGYSVMGFVSVFSGFVVAMIIITFAEMAGAPPALTLTSRLTPVGRTGRYMGIYGFVVASGWSFGPLYGNSILDWLCHDSPPAAWGTIASLGIVAAIGYMLLQRRISANVNGPKAV
jgi:MFS family permease